MIRTRMSTYLIAGALAGLAGAVEIFGPAGRVVTGSTPTLGFSALVVATVGALGVSGTVTAATFRGRAPSRPPVPPDRLGPPDFGSADLRRTHCHVHHRAGRHRDPSQAKRRRARSRIRSDRRDTPTRSRPPAELIELGPVTGPG